MTLTIHFLFIFFIANLNFLVEFFLIKKPLVSIIFRYIYNFRVAHEKQTLVSHVAYHNL